MGQTLTAVTTGILDADGLTSPTYTYQWIRVDGTEADISGENSSTYTLVAADLGKTIKVRVSFDDDAGNTETLTSAASATVVAAATAPTVSNVAVTAEQLLIVVGHAGLHRAAVELPEHAGPEPARQLVVDARFEPTVAQAREHCCQWHELRAIGQLPPVVEVLPGRLRYHSRLCIRRPDSALVDLEIARQPTTTTTIAVDASGSLR